MSERVSLNDRRGVYAVYHYHVICIWDITELEFSKIVATAILVYNIIEVTPKRLRGIVDFIASRLASIVYAKPANVRQNYNFFEVDFALPIKRITASIRQIRAHKSVMVLAIRLREVSPSRNSENDVVFNSRYYVIGCSRR